MYDFSGVSNDLAILRSQLFTLNVGEKPKPNNHVSNQQWDILHIQIFKDVLEIVIFYKVL